MINRLSEGERVAMSVQGKTKGIRMISEIVRLKGMGLGVEKIAKALGISKNTVKKYIKAQDGVMPDKKSSTYQAPWSHLIDWIDVKVATDRGECVHGYWEDKILTHQNPNINKVPYTSFWREYKRRYPHIPIDFHKNHPPGERCEIDYKGDSAGLGYFDRAAGVHVSCRLFGMILCFSQRVFMRATLSEKQADLFQSISKGFEAFEGVPLTSAVDNAKATVTKADRYDADLNSEFHLLCNHFGTAPLAMRPGKPKDKNLIENALGVFWRWLRPKLRGKSFFSLAELNQFIYEMTELFNNRIQRKYGLSRIQKFLDGEKSKLLPLPVEPYRFGEWRKAKPHPDCHIQVKNNFYSVPYELRSKELDVRVTSSFIEVFHELERVAIHLAGSEPSRGRYFTKTIHLPPSHQAMLETTPKNILADAEDVGEATFYVIDNLVNKATHPLLFLRRCQGILRLRNRYSSKALEEACATLITLRI
jgi:hypothetical protein